MTPRAHRNIDSDTLVEIYALCEPATKEVRYVGKTWTGTRSRMKGHFYEARTGQRAKDVWIKGLLDQSLEPYVQVLGTVTFPFWEQAEIEWIATFSGSGRLFNCTAGGEFSCLPTPELRVRMSASAKARGTSPTQLAGLAKGHLKMPKGTEHHLARLNDAAVLQIRQLKAEGWSYQRLADEFGVTVGTVVPAVNGVTWKHVGGLVPRDQWKRAQYPPQSDEHRRKIGDRNRGKKRTPEQLERQSASRQGIVPWQATNAAAIANQGEKHHHAKLTDDAVREMRSASAQGEKGVSLALRFGVSGATVSKVLRGDIWRHVT